MIRHLTKRIEALEAGDEHVEYRLYWHDDPVPAGVTPIQLNWGDSL